MNTITYMTGLLTFYLRGEVSTDQNFLKLYIPNTILALIPYGSTKDNIPVNQIASVSSYYKFNLKRFLAGLLICWFGIFCIRQCFFWTNVAAIICYSIGGIFSLLWGVSAIITSFVTEVYVATTSGREFFIPFLKFEQDKAPQAERLISNMITGRLNDTNYRQVAEEQTNAIVDAIKNNR